jgi:hypothetical protein
MGFAQTAKEAVAKKTQTNPVATRFNLPRFPRRNMLYDPTIEGRFLLYKPFMNQEVHPAFHQSGRVWRVGSRFSHSFDSGMSGANGNGAWMSYSDQRRKMRAPLVPPKPKEFDSATSTFAACGLLGM